ncbi:hypothetical protein GQ43DRAFT_420239 [Delitschia confertaspora ATCC 74209]|uniref:Protein PNS1 n=1 Tax=Delitschia confertaspora ATCC 74209 TaxID=1513339 RepID=A0A9P4MTV4_9PLEO|nr:hypothetical protein GQ43DRAFT_420239 [Delitschia confertaspora ATCC 74209]
MFSEYASKFLSQSQSRLSLGQPDMYSNRNPLDRQRPPSRTRATASYLQRRPMQNPYSSQMSRFPFASRTSNAPAPLFYSATDDFREEDDVEEHHREMADHYALQRSRRQFGGSHLSESDEREDLVGRSDHTIDGNNAENDVQGYGLGQGIKSSWGGDDPTERGRSKTLEEYGPEERDKSIPPSEASVPSSKGKAKLVDVELSTVQDSMEHLDREALMVDMNNQPPSYQQFRATPKSKRGRSPLRTTLPIPQETDEEALLGDPRPVSSDRESVMPHQIVANPASPPKHNLFWAELFIIAQCAVFGVFFISILKESPPDKKHPLGDTIYTVLHSSFHLLGVYSLVSVIIGMLWLSLLRSFARPLIILILIAVPSISFSFFIYPLVSSYRGNWHGNSFQDRVMRWSSIIPGVFAVIWVYTVWKARYSLNKASDMLEFSGRVLTAMSPLLAVGLVSLVCVVFWSWIWTLMFTRLFLGGHFTKSRWIIDLSTWWLGAAFVLDYLWTLGIIAGIQRTITAATVSQWYFHRNNVPTPSARSVVQASAIHATTAMAGTVCFSTFLSLIIRVPLIVLPRRLSGLLRMVLFSLVPTPIAVLTNPLTLTYASVHGLSLGAAARGLSNMQFVSKASPTTTLGPRSFSRSNGSQDLVAYRLAKLLLHAIRFVMCLALGFGGWISTARMLEIGGSGYKGSLYAYIVGLISATIGWGALGAMEGVLGGILDALLICWGSEVGTNGHGEVRYCREAGELFAANGNTRWS